MSFLKVDYEKINNMNDRELHIYTLNKMIDIENKIIDKMLDVEDREKMEELLEFRDNIHNYIYEMGTLLGLDNYKKYKGLVTW